MWFSRSGQQFVSHCFIDSEYLIDNLRDLVLDLLGKRLKKGSDYFRKNPSFLIKREWNVTWWWLHRVRCRRADWSGGPSWKWWRTCLLRGVPLHKTKSSPPESWTARSCGWTTPANPSTVSGFQSAARPQRIPFSACSGRPRKLRISSRNREDRRTPFSFCSACCPLNPESCSPRSAQKKSSKCTGNSLPIASTASECRSEFCPYPSDPHSTHGDSLSTAISLDTHSLSNQSSAPLSPNRK